MKFDQDLNKLSDRSKMEISHKLSKDDFMNNYSGNYKVDDGLNRNRLEEILSNLDNVTITVIGDGTIDIYWDADMTQSRLSRETPHFPLPVVKERISLGGAANVANNLIALGVKEVQILTIIGKDWRGREFKSLLNKKGIGIDYLIEDEDRITPAYCKPIKYGLSEVSYENPRIDFENQVGISSSLEMKVIQKIDQIVKGRSSIAVADQLKNGIITEKVRKKIIKSEKKGFVIVDSRNNIHKFSNVILKPNHLEALNAVNLDQDVAKTGLGDWIKAGMKLSSVTRSPVLMTIGEQGAFWIDNKFKTVIKVPSVPAKGEIDFVGAGDSFMSAFIATRAAGAKPGEAINIANLAAAVTVKKLRMTGTATREDIIKKYEEI